MYDPMLFRDRPRPAQIVLGGLIPAVFGAIAGVLLGASSGGYWAWGALAAIGSIAGGFEHPNARAGAIRGLVAGAIYGAALLLAHAIAGNHAKVSLGSFPPFLIIITAIAGMLLSALGGRIARQGRDRRAAPAE
jgi:hypothetical protein